MKISTGTPENHPSVLAIDASHSPAVAAATPRFPSETTRDGAQGGVLSDISGPDFTSDATAAIHAGMSVDNDRRSFYEADIRPVAANYGLDMNLPPVTSDMSKHTGSPDAAGTGPAG